MEESSERYSQFFLRGIDEVVTRLQTSHKNDLEDLPGLFRVYSREDLLYKAVKMGECKKKEGRSLAPPGPLAACLPPDCKDPYTEKPHSSC